MQSNPKELSSQLGIWSLVGLTVGNMVGAGLYVSSHYALQSIGDAFWVMVVWGMGGLLAFAGAIAYGAVVRRVPFSGGEYSFLSKLFHPLLGYFAGFVSLLVGFTVPIASAALVVGKYLAWDQDWSLLPSLIGSSVIAVAAVLYITNFRLGAGFQNGLIGLKLSLLTLFVLLGVWYGVQNGFESGQLATLETPPTQPLWLRMCGSLYWISLCYVGYNAPCYLAGEFREGDNRIPRAMWISVVLIGLFYLSLNAVCLYVVAPEVIATNETFFADVGRAIGGPKMEVVVRAVIAISGATSVLAMLVAGPFVYRQMQVDFPYLLGKAYAGGGASNASGMPRIWLMVQAALAILLTFRLELQQILSVLGLTLMLCGALAVSGIWRIPVVFKGSEPIRWYEHLCAGIFVGCTLLLIGIAAQFKSNEFYLSMKLLGVAGGLALLQFVATKWWSTRPDTNP